MTTATKYGSWALTADPPDGVGAALAEALAERGLNVVQLSCQLISLCRKTSHHSTLPRSAMSSHRPSTIPPTGRPGSSARNSAPPHSAAAMGGETTALRDTGGSG
ncbi:MAG: hypothetical protein JO330_04185 [Mycobacteriaceae bacterium]|nr:hypothetical protein [Mycobacteriaceae bacterium]